MPKEIIIDSYIGNGYYSKQYIRAMLKNASDVVAKLSSLGGDLNHALDIHDQFAEHGNVTIEFTGFNASSSTILSLGASKIKMSANSYYLIHKVMSWVDEWGHMNEDDLEALIQELEKEKDENAKITLNVAKMYAAKTGKSVKEILDLMKKEVWLTAEEALEWGFVDEIFNPKSTKVNLLDDYKMVAMISASGFPTPIRKSQKSNTMSKNEMPKDKKSLIAAIGEAFGITPKEKSAKEVVDPKDQKIIDLEKENETLKAKAAEKGGEETVDPKDQKITDLEKENETLKAKAAEKGGEETVDPKDQKIADLEKENATLKTSAAQDIDISKDGDDSNTSAPDEFMNSVAEAQKLNALIDEIS